MTDAWTNKPLPLPFTNEEIEDLLIKKVTQPVKEGTDRIYLHFVICTE